MPLCIATLLFALHCVLLTSCVAFRCTHLSGALVQIDVGVGQVMGVNKDDSIFTRYGSSWTQLPGKLKHVTVGPAGVWGANRENHIFKLVGTDWLNVPGLLKQIDAGGDQFVAGANHVDAPFCLPKENTVGYSGSNSALNWRQIPGSLKYYSCGPYSCWGVNSGDQIFVRKGVNSFNCEGDGTWQKVPGSLSMIEVGSDGSVYGVNSAGGVFRRDSTSACQPEGTGWTHLPLYSGQVKHVSYDLGHLWLILNNDAIYDCTEL